MQDETPPCLAAKIQKARKNLSRIGKDKWDEINGCSYTSAEHMIEACRNALDRSGLALVAKSVRLLYHSPGQVSIFRKFELHDLSKPEVAYFDYEYIMESSQGQTLTKSLYHFLKDLFLLPRLDEEPKPSTETKLFSTDDLSNVASIPEVVNE